MHIQGKLPTNESRTLPSQYKINSQCRERLYELSCLSESVQQQQYEVPSPRANSQLVYYKNKLYLFGGFQLEQHHERSIAFYSYDIETKKWSIHFPKAFSQELAKFTPKASVVAGNKWFMLGSEADESTQKESSKIWKLNFDLMDWTTAQQRGEVIKHLQGGCLVSYQKNFLVYYGGYSYSQNKGSNSVYLYNIDSKTWHKCQGNYLKAVKSRFCAGMVNINNRIFLYGGYYKQAESLQCLNDFYQITLRLPGKGIVPQAYFKSMPNSSPPRAQHHLLALDNNTICLFGGKNSQALVETEFWTFNTITWQWKMIDRIQDKISKREGSSIVVAANNIFIFGGIQEQHQKLRLCGDLWSLNVNYSRVYSSQQQFEKIEAFMNGEYSHNCKLCFQKTHNFSINTGKFSAEIIDGAISLITFPYAAFGLLVDNSVSMGANVVNITIQGDQSSHYLCIEDNAKTTFSEQDLISCMYAFEGTSNMIMSGFDKKTKKQIQKDNHLKEYGTNLKIGALRLGKKFLFVSGNGETIHLFLCLKDKIEYKQSNSSERQQTEKQVYMFHYYAINAITKQLINPEMQSSRQFIESRYRKQIKLVTATKAVKNTLFIFETFLNSKQEQITINYQNHDVFFGDKLQIDKLTGYGYNINDCIDVSLRAYLSVLYLRCEQNKINFGIRHSSVTIIPQAFLQKIDKACRTGQVVELQDVLQFDFKLVEIYWQREIRRNNHFFSNGLLIYSKNRLICRFRIQLGGLLPLMAKQVTGITNYLPFFGYTQLPQHIPVNVFKTGFSFNILIEKLFCRLKFVEQGFKKRQALLVRANKLNSKSDRREKPGDQYVWGYKKRNRKIEQTNIEPAVSSVKDKTSKVPDPQNIAFVINQNKEQNKSNEQCLKKTQIQMVRQEMQIKEIVIQSEQLQK